MEPILHLSVPVTDKAEAKAFYTDVLGCRSGRESTDTADVWFLGLQLTLHELPEEVLSDQGSRHFGATLGAEQWRELCDRIAAHQVEWIKAPFTRNEGTSFEESKAYLADPSGNVIELKSYADPEATVLSQGSTYQ
jgi:extradiol dioxygenase family protein